MLFSCTAHRSSSRWFFHRLILITAAALLLVGNAMAGQLTLAWDPVSNATGYRLYYGQSSGNYSANVDAKNQTSYTLTGLTNGATYYLAVKAYNSTATSAYSNQISAVVPSASPTPTPTPTAAPVASFTANPTTGVAPLMVSLQDTSTGTITNRTWNLGDGSTATSSSVAKNYTNPGTYNVKLTVTGSGGSTTATKSITVTSPPVTGGGGTPSPTPAPTTNASGLVAAYGFEEASGTTTVQDASGNGNHGTVREANTTRSGRFGRGIRFDGVNDWITINDSPSLDLSTRMTLEAWVYPTVWMNKGASVLVKEDGTRNSVYYLYANEDANTPMGGERVNGYRTVTGVTQLPPNQWAHLAVTYDGQYNRLYLNGKLVSIQAQTGTISTSSGVLRIGGNSIWKEFFTGVIDELRIYKRALTEAEIYVDSQKSIK